MDIVSTGFGTFAQFLQDSAAIRASDAFLANASAVIGRPYQRAIGHVGFEAVVGPLISVTELIQQMDHGTQLGAFEAAIHLLRTVLMSADRGIHLLPKRIEKLGAQMGRFSLIKEAKRSKAYRLLANLGLNRIIRLTSISYYGIRILSTRAELRRRPSDPRLKFRVTMCAMQIFALSSSLVLGGTPLAIIALAAAAMEIGDRAWQALEDHKGKKSGNMTYGTNALEIAKGTAQIAEFKGQSSEESRFASRCVTSLGKIQLSSAFFSSCSNWTSQLPAYSVEGVATDIKLTLGFALDIILQLPGINRVQKMRYAGSSIYWVAKGAQAAGIVAIVTKLGKKVLKWWYPLNSSSPSTTKKGPVKKWTLRGLTLIGGATTAGALGIRLFKLYPHEQLVKGVSSFVKGVAGVGKTLITAAA